MSGIGDIRKACDALSGLLLARRSDALRVASALRRLLTVKLGDFSEWNGHRPEKLAPVFFSCT